MGEIPSAGQGEHVGSLSLKIRYEENYLGVIIKVARWSWELWRFYQVSM